MTEEIGSGGGHSEKAGGFIYKEAFEKAYPGAELEAYFKCRMEAYLSNMIFSPDGSMFCLSYKDGHVEIADHLPYTMIEYRGSNDSVTMQMLYSYPVYDLSMLITDAREVLGDIQLTDQEKQLYHIE